MVKEKVADKRTVCTSRQPPGTYQSGRVFKRLSVSSDEEAVRTGAAMVLRAGERALVAEEDERGRQTQATDRSKLASGRESVQLKTQSRDQIRTSQRP